MNRGERFTRETTTPGTSSSSTSWSTRAKVIGELVVGVADVGEVGVDARHDLRREVDVEVTLGGAVFVVVHALPPYRGLDPQVYDPPMSASPVAELAAAVERRSPAVGGDGMPVAARAARRPGARRLRHGDRAPARKAAALRAPRHRRPDRRAARVAVHRLGRDRRPGLPQPARRRRPGTGTSSGACWSEGRATARARSPTPQRIQVEYVSGNPTGPVTVATARNAAYGDSLARLFEFAGHEVGREYYFNDAGRQIDLFGESLKARARGRRSAGGRLPGRVRGRRRRRARARAGRRRSTSGRARAPTP